MLLAGIHVYKALTYTDYSMESILRSVNDTSQCHYSGKKSRPEAGRVRLCRNDEVIRIVLVK